MKVYSELGATTPEFSLKFYNFFLVTAAGLVSAALLYFGTGLHPIWWLLWLAPVPVLAIAPRLHGGAAFLLGFIAWLIGEMNQWNYVRNQIELPLLITILYFLIPAVVFGLGVFFMRSFLRRGWPFLAALAFPVYWVACEYLNAISSPHSTWGNLAYTQMNCLPVIQIASITGIWGISFIMFLFAGTTAALLSGAGKPWQRRALAIAVGAAVCAVFVFGKWRLQSTSWGQPVAVTLVAKDVPMSVYLGSEEQALQLFREYAEEVHHSTPAGTEAVVLPEKIGRISESALAEVDTLFSSAATATRTAIVLGLVRKTPSAGFNSSRFYSPGGRMEANYDKHHLLPGVEPENLAINECCSTSRRVVGDCKFARTWTFPSSAANTPCRVRTCCWCRRGTLISIDGCTRGWPCCARSRTVSRWPARRAMACSLLATIAVASLRRRRRCQAASYRLLGE